MIYFVQQSWPWPMVKAPYIWPSLRSLNVHHTVSMDQKRLKKDQYDGVSDNRARRTIGQDRTVPAWVSPLVVHVLYGALSWSGNRCRTPRKTSHLESQVDRTALPNPDKNCSESLPDKSRQPHSVVQYCKGLNCHAHGIYASPMMNHLLEAKHIRMSACSLDLLACAKRNVILTLRMASLAHSITHGSTISSENPICCETTEYYSFMSNFVARDTVCWPLLSNLGSLVERCVLVRDQDP